MVPTACTRGKSGGGPQRVTPDLKLSSLWLNLERTLDKGRRGKMGVVRRRQLKRSSLSEAMTKKVVRFLEETQGDTHQLPPRVTPTLVTPLAVPNVHQFLLSKLSRGQNAQF